MKKDFRSKVPAILKSSLIHLLLLVALCITGFIAIIETGLLPLTLIISIILNRNIMYIVSWNVIKITDVL